MSEKKADAKKVDAQEKRKAMGDYDRNLEVVRKVKAMTDTSAWQLFYSELQRRIRKHSESVLDAEKPRDVIHHQEGVKVIRSLIAQIRKPIEELNTFISAMPLFAQDMEIRATWNDALGKIELHSIK